MNTKVIIALVAVTALALAAVGLAAAQIAQNQTQIVPGADPNTVPAEGFWGWIGNCFGYRTAEPNQGQYVVPPAVSDGQAPAPYQNGYGYANGYGYGPCWAR